MARLFSLLIALAAALPGEESTSERSERLQREPLHSVSSWFRKKQNDLSWFRTVDKQAVDETYSVMLVQAAPVEQQPGRSKPSPIHKHSHIGVFVVYGTTNQVYMVLDIYPLSEGFLYPSMEKPTRETVYLHFLSDYGLYHGSYRYEYDLRQRKPARKLRYGRLRVVDRVSLDGKLHYTAAFGVFGEPQRGLQPHTVTIALEPRSEAAPRYEVLSDKPGAEIGGPAADGKPIPAGRGESLFIENAGADSQRKSGIFVISAKGTRKFFPVPGPKGSGMMNDIGPAAFDRDKLWFANTFYDGEGTSGVGAIGTFHVATRKYEMRYLPEIARWSGSALLHDGDDLWIGLSRRPEGATYGGGLLRYNTQTGAVRTYPVTDLISFIDRVQDALYLGTSHGVYMLREDKLTQLRFEPDADSRLVMLMRDVTP